MRALMDHSYINPEYLKAFIKKYNTTLDTHYQTILVKLDTRYNPSNLSMIEQYIYQAFELTGSKLYTFNYSNEYMAIFDNLDISILLGNISADTKRQYLDKTIAKLSEKELELLETYFFHDMSLKDTCEELYLHKNTLQYKLDKIHKTTGYNPRNFKNAVVLYIGLKLLKLEQ